MTSTRKTHVFKLIFLLNIMSQYYVAFIFLIHKFELVIRKIKPPEESSIDTLQCITCLINHFNIISQLLKTNFLRALATSLQVGRPGKLLSH